MSKLKKNKHKQEEEKQAKRVLIWLAVAMVVAAVVFGLILSLNS
jgi:flagellar basal body-associated protein FliL